MADVLIVGAGIVGLLSALELADRGAEVTVVDAGSELPPASWAGGGILSPLYAWRYPDAMNRLTVDAPARYRALFGRLEGQAGLRRDDLNESGLWVAAEGDEQRRALDWAAPRNIPCQAMPLSAHLPDGIGGDGVWFPEIGNIRNPRLLKALRAALASRVRFVSGRAMAVRPRTPGARVELADGRSLAASQVLISAGAWSPALLEPLGVAVELFPAKGEMLLYRLAPGRVSCIVLTEGGYLIPRADGAVLVGSTHHAGNDSLLPTEEDGRHLRALAARLLPELAAHRPAHHWAGVRPGCGRPWPWLGAVPGQPDIFAAVGHHRNGLVAAPASAELLAQLISGESTALNPADYSFSVSSS